MQPMQHEEPTRNRACHDTLILANFGDDDDEAEKLLMRSINETALALSKSPLTDEDSERIKTPKDVRRLCVRQDTIDDADDNYVIDDAQMQDHQLECTVTDMTPSTLPATEKRTKDEVDVAAAGIPLEVRRMQCTKSTLAIKEATKNDATPQSSKLVHFIVSMTSGGSHMCTEKEMCQWLVAQMCDRMETGQIWIMAKTYALLSALLWRGSNTFVEAMHEYGRAMFQAAHVTSLIKTTPQENLTGERLPCSLQPIVKSAAGQKSAAGKVKPCAPCLFQKLKLKTCGEKAASRDDSDDKQTLSDSELGFFVSNVAYLESLCEYRVRHPTLDLAHGEILMVDPADSAARADPVAATVVKKTYSPTAWKEVLDDTLELMKAIAVMDPHAPVCALGATTVNFRIREALLLYQVACRALVRLLHAVLTVSHTFVASIQAGLQLPSTNLSPSDHTSSPTTSSTSTINALGVTFDPAALDYSLTPDIVHEFSHEYYFAIYQFNRTVHMLRDYCERAQHVDPATSKRALASLKVLPEACVIEFKESRKKFEHPVCSTTIVALHKVAKETAERLRQSQPIDGVTTAPVDTTGSNACNDPACATAAKPMCAEDVRRSMLALYEFHVANKMQKQELWKHQVDALCDLFDEKESQMLRQIFRSGLEGLWQQWQEFTNNGAAAAEKALMTSVDSNSFNSKRTFSITNGLSSSDNAGSADRVNSKQDSGIDAITKSSTYILRSLPSGVQTSGSNTTPRADIIPLDRSTASESSTESSIDALLQEDDVVVICNEECSCNDTLKLVDRFQVLLDVPLGEGSYGKVYRAWDEVVGCYLAAKELPLDASKAHNVAVREVLQEYTVLTELSHPNIVRVVAFMVLKQTARIYMEWMPSGSLQDVLRHHPRGMLRESVVRRYARDVLSGLAFLHSRGVIHRDVKPGNMLLSSDGSVKLTDFGTSLVLSGNTKTLDSNSVTGTAAYMAPECVQGTYSSASDIWSFGCSIVQLISGNVPWSSPTTASMMEPIALLFKVGSLDDTTHLERPHDALKEHADAVQVEKDLTTSLSSAQTSETSDGGEEKAQLKQPVSAELLSMLDAIFVVDRKKRPSASELLQHPFFKVK